MSESEEIPDRLRLSIWVNLKKDPEIYHFFRDAFDGNISATARMLMSVGAQTLLAIPGIVSREHRIEFGNMLPVTIPAKVFADTNNLKFPSVSDFASSSAVREETPPAKPERQKPRKPRQSVVTPKAKPISPLAVNPDASQHTAKPLDTRSLNARPLEVNPLDNSSGTRIEPSDAPTQAELLAAAASFDALDSSI